MDTNDQKYVIKNVSAGGFIFHKDKKTLRISVLLVKNNKAEWWIPKGELKTDETQLDASFREIREKIGLNFNQLKYIGFCDSFAYGYDINSDEFLMKDLFINVFESYGLYNLTVQEEIGLMDVCWFSYEDALRNISFTKDKLKKAYEIFVKSMTNVNSLYSIALMQIQQQLGCLSCANDISSIILYGSMYKKIFEVDIQDTDFIIVVKDITKDYGELFKYMEQTFKNLDFHIYTIEELDEKVAFYTREYVLEYLSKGITLWGNNPFISMYEGITTHDYKRSILIRTIAHVQMVRKVYFSNKSNFDYKMLYLKKYILRIGKNILLSSGKYDYDTLDKMSTDQIFKELSENNFIKKAQTEGFNELKPIEFFYNIFCDLSDNITNIKKELDFQVPN